MLWRECLLQSGRAAAKHAFAMECRHQYGDDDADGRTFDGADHEGADDSEREDTCGKRIRYKYQAEYETEEPPDRIPRLPQNLILASTS
jgi:hypothetical protein